MKAGRLARLLGRLRWVVIALWIAAAVASVTLLPSIDSARSGALGALVPKEADAIKAELASKTQFGFPLLSRTILVQRNPNGMSVADQARAVRLAASLTRGQEPGLSGIVGALPVTNGIGGPPYVRERSTTAVTYLFFKPDIGLVGRAGLSDRLIERRVAAIPGGVTATTGQAPALIEQADLIVDRLPLIELATLLLVAAAVGLRFRAIGAPLLTLVTVAIAYVVSSRVVASFGARAGIAVPQEVEPVIVVLLFGVVTDYSIFYLSRFRALLATGLPRRDAAELTAAQFTPIISVAGASVVVATLTLLAARLEFLRVFGPGLAFAVLVGLLVSVTFIPAAMAVAGNALFWPRRPRVELGEQDVAEEPAQAAATRPKRSRVIAFACSRPRIVIAGCVLVLGVASTGVFTLRLANPVIRGLPADSGTRQAYEAAAKGFAPGIISPTVLVVSGPGVGGKRTALARLQHALERQRGVALVLGPAQQQVSGVRLGATLSKTGDAARYFLVLREDPLGAAAIDDLRRLDRRTAGLLRQAGLSDASAAYAGDTALSLETIDKTVADLRRIAPLTLLAIFLVVALFVRAIVAPLYLVAASALGFAAALGIASFVFGELTYFVPFAAAVLLLSLGSDYNVFLIGRIWQEAEVRPLAEAVPVAASRAAQAITLAGIVLAGSFALIALVPLRSFAELATLMGLGLMLDAFLIRTVFVPALVTAVGPVSGWPGGRLRRAAAGAGSASVAERGPLTPEALGGEGAGGHRVGQQ